MKNHSVLSISSFKIKKFPRQNFLKTHLNPNAVAIPTTAVPIHNTEKPKCAATKVPIKGENTNAEETDNAFKPMYAPLRSVEPRLTVTVAINGIAKISERLIINIDKNKTHIPEGTRRIRKEDAPKNTPTGITDEERKFLSATCTISISKRNTTNPFEAKINPIFPSLR